MPCIYSGDKRNVSLGTFEIRLHFKGPGRWTGGITGAIDGKQFNFSMPDDAPDSGTVFEAISQELDHFVVQCGYMPASDKAQEI